MSLLLSAVLLGLLGASVFSLMQPTVYTATSVGNIVVSSGDTIGSATAALDLATLKGAQYAPLVSSQAVREGVRAALPQARVGALQAIPVEGSTLFRINASAPTAIEARDVANAAMKATAAEALRLESMQEDGTSTGKSLIRLVPTEQAGLPATPVSPTWLVNLGVGAVAGLLLGYLLAFARRSIDRRMRTQEDVEEVSGASVLGMIPRTDQLANAQGTAAVADMGPVAESLRQLRTNLQFVSVDDPPRSIVVTSANPGEGKSTVAANLARVLAQAGTSVVLVDADLRRPTQGKRFGVDGSVGLTSVLASNLALADALQPTAVEGLFVLPAGRIPPNPSELVGSKRMRQAIDALSQAHTVIIDAPPMLPVTDAGLLTAASDGALLVVKSGGTQKEQVQQCLRLLAHVNGHLFGTVLNLIPRRSMGTAMYGYGFGGYGTGYESEYVQTSERRSPARALDDERS